MRKLVAFLSTLILSGSIYGQNYFFSQSASPYTELTGATVLTSSAPWSYATAFTVPIGFSFTFMSNNYTSVFAEGGGFTYFDPGYLNLILPYGVQLQSKGSSGNNSPISYITDGIAPMRICKIEWKNAGFYYDTTQTVNFQLWLYETTNTIEVHIGYTDVSNPAVVFLGNGSDGPVVNISEWATAAFCNYGLSLTGNPGAAFAQPVSGNLSVFSNSLNAPPDSGTVYTFMQSVVGISATFTAPLFSVAQDNVQALLVFQPLVSGTKASFEITDCNGKTHATGSLLDNTLELQTQHWAAGIYFVRIFSAQQAEIKKIAIIH